MLLRKDNFQSVNEENVKKNRMKLPTIPLSLHLRGRGGGGHRTLFLTVRKIFTIMIVPTISLSLHLRERGGGGHDTLFKSQGKVFMIIVLLTIPLSLHLRERGGGRPRYAFVSTEKDPHDYVYDVTSLRDFYAAITLSLTVG